jgi:hypothetical protein
MHFDDERPKPRYNWLDEPDRSEVRQLQHNFSSEPKPQPSTSYYKPEPQGRMSMDEIFHRYLPGTMYQSHYELSTNYGYTPSEWRTYLRDNSLFIETELAAIAEAEARSALSRLSNASGQEVAALKAILEKSKLINDAQKQATKIIITHIPKTEDKKPYEGRI